MRSHAAAFRRWGAAALCCGVLGCGGSARPDLVAWQARWARVLALVPAEREFGAWDATSRCTSLLAGIRRGRAELIPTPEEGLDAAVAAWLRRAEGLAFDCPMGPARQEARQAAYAELAVLQAEVEAGLRRAGSG